MGPASPRRCPRSRPHCGFPAVTRRSRSTEHVRQGSLVLVGARRIGGVDEPGHYGCIPAGRSVAFGRTWPSGGRRSADVHATWPAGPSVSRCAKPIWGNVRSFGNRYGESLGKPDSEGASLQREVVSRTYSHHFRSDEAPLQRNVIRAWRLTRRGGVRAGPPVAAQASGAPVKRARAASRSSWNRGSRAAGCGVAASLVVPVAAAGARFGFVAGGEPLLGQVPEPEVVGGSGAAHLGGHPAGVDGVAVDVGPEPGDGDGEGGDEAACCRSRRRSRGVRSSRGRRGRLARRGACRC